MGQLEHIQSLIELAIRYVTDCDGCAEGVCPLLVEITEHTSDLPALPSGLTICNLFDYITQNTYRAKNSTVTRKEVDMEDGAIRKIKLKVRGKEYEATIARLTAHAADSHSPWQKEDVLQVWLSFEHVEGKYPGSTLSFGVTLSVKDYKPDELLALIKREGERELERFAVKADEDRRYNQAKESRQKELDGFATHLTESLKEAG